MKVGVIGSGSWATAILKILQTNGVETSWYIRGRESVDYVVRYGSNPKYLTGVDIDTRICFPSDDIDEVVESCQMLVLAIPSAFIAETLEKVSVPLTGKSFLTAIKGLVPRENRTVSDYLVDAYGVDTGSIAYVTGPCHAEEVAQERLSYLTIASGSPTLAEQIAAMLRTRFISVCTTADIAGAQYASVMKNIYAVAAGISHGLGYGDNYLAVLVSNAAQEMERLLDRICGPGRDIKRTAYLGDLLVTAYSQFSRNRTFGSLVGRGHSVRAAQAEMLMVAEGYYASRSIHEANQSFGAEIPIADAVYRILYERANAKKVFDRLNDSMH